MACGRSINSDPERSDHVSFSGIGNGEPAAIVPSKGTATESISVDLNLFELDPALARLSPRETSECRLSYPPSLSLSKLYATTEVELILHPF